MASGVNVKMGVSGVAKFKQDMNQAKQSVKTLDAQLALTEKQFKASGDAESYMTEKAALLQAKLEQQKSVVASAEKALEQMRANGVDRASTAYQSMYQQMLRAKGELLDTENAMEGVADAGEDAANGVDEMNTQMKRIGDGVSWQNVTDGLEKITSAMGNVISKAAAVGQAIINATLGAGSWADTLGETADKYEMSPEKLYRMQQVADFIDTDVDTIISAQDKLAKNNAQKGTSYMGAMSFLEIDPNGKSNIDLFWEAGEAIANLGENADKTYYAQQIFGKSWRELLPLFKAGREEYDKYYNEKTTWIGDEAFENLTKLDDASQDLQNNWETMQNTFLGTLAGPMTQVFEVLTGVLQQFNEYLQSDEGKEALQQMGETITNLISDLANIKPEDAVNTLKDIVDKITEGLKWISEHSSDVVTAVEAFIAVWAGLKVAEGVTIVLKLIDGIKGLTAGSAAAAGASAGASWAGAFASAAMKAAPFLAFLYTLLNPSAGSDALGSNDLVDANGQLTKEAQAYGYQLDENGQAYLPETPEWMRKYQEEAVKKKLESTYVGDTEAATERNQHWLNNNRTLEDLQSAADKMERTAEELSGGTDKQKQSSSEMTTAAGTLKGMPGQVEAAIIRGMSQIKIVIDGQQMSNAIEPHMSSSMGGRVYMLTK